jgi:hypothetical protein
MTEEELRKAYFEWRRTASQNLHPSATMKNATPKHSLEARMEYLEADALAQRTAILRLEKAAKLICKSLWALFAVLMTLALNVLT